MRDSITLVREATAEDLDVVLQLVDALIREDAGAHDPGANLDWASMHGRDHLGGIVADSSRVALLAERDGVTAGGLLGNLLGPWPFQPVTVARLGSLYVTPAFRSLGVGAALVEAFVTWASDRQVTITQVTAYAVNHRAISFYQRQGLVPYELVLRGQLPPNGS